MADFINENYFCGGWLFAEQLWMHVQAVGQGGRTNGLQLTSEQAAVV
jgi:hypothetical protein